MGLSESEFQGLVVDVAEQFGWLTYHTFDSRRSGPGFPDLVLVRGDRVVFAELKSQSGRLSADQRVWLERLTGAGTVEAYLWRPSDEVIVVKLLAVPTTAAAAGAIWREWVVG